MTETPASGAKPIEELKTERDERDFIVLTDAALKMCYADKVRIREVTSLKPKKWYQFWK